MPEPAKAQAPFLDTTVPHSARVWNYWLGGKDNYPADRAVGEQVREVYPEIIDVARESRGFLARAVRFLAEDAGIRQFLDIGTGLPTAGNTHEVAQEIAPEARVVYVDRDPLVLVHARALLTSTPQGVTAYVDADVRDPRAILAAAGDVLDFTQPVGLMMLGVLGNVADVDEAGQIVSRLVDAIPPGSYVVINDGTIADAEAARGAMEAARRRKDAGDPYYPRTPEQIARYVDGLELVEPGVVSTPLWRPEPGVSPRPIGSHGVVARKK
ncbi:SAM-dependent methyltransferase [Pseudofrankia sp. DC12]|uniref:SAM-dependent methyltransferase n=1 Tax=Pseudofrankia sp. DC12 TaxID=683315 RepID=UPI001E2BC91E|nr:SAM-dependent methyltransferase [Pseudofrankia sp. DC12]